MFKAARINKSTGKLIETIDANDTKYSYKELKFFSDNHELFCENYTQGCRSLVTYVNNDHKGRKNFFRTLSEHNEDCEYRYQYKRININNLGNFEEFLKNLDSNQVHFNETKDSQKYYNLTNLRDLVHALKSHLIHFTDIFNNKYLYTYFQTEDDLYRNLRLNISEYKYYILNAKLSKKGHFYITYKENKHTYINLKNPIENKENEYYSVVVLLSPNDFKKLSKKDKEKNVLNKTIDLPNERIFYLKNNSSSVINQLAQDLNKIPYFYIKPFNENKEVILSPYFSDLSLDFTIDNDRIKNPVDFILEELSSNHNHNLLNLEYSFSIFSKETFKHDEPIMKYKNDNIKSKQRYTPYIPLHYECRVKFKDEDSLKQVFQTIKENTYLKAQLLFEDNENFDMSGAIIFSCGILVQDFVYIKMQNQPLDKKEKDLIDKFFSPIDIQYSSSVDFLDGITHHNIYNLIVYNVGHGECSVCNMFDQKDQLIHVFFDYGHSFFPDDLATPHIIDAIDEIKSLKIHTLVLSHWDNDHILFFTYGCGLTPSSQFVVPNLDLLKEYERSSTAKRFFDDLKLYYTAAIIDINKSSRIIYDKGHFQITTGQFASSSHRTSPITKTTYRVKRNNNCALIVKISANKKVLIPGDCDYKKMHSTVLNDKYDVLLVSHHGAHTGEPPQGNEDAEAIICCSDHYGEPQFETLKDLNNKGYNNIIVFKDETFSKIGIL